MVIEDLNKTHKSVLRNPAIAEMLYFAGYIERWGSGIKAMNTLVKQAGLPEPAYEEIGSNFVVTFKKALRGKKEEKAVVQEDAEKVAEKVRSKCGESAEKVFLAIDTDAFIKTHEIVYKTELSQRTVENAVAKLKKAKFLKRIGSPKGGHWEVLDGD
ncbi:MAG: hypothetical protein KAJ18_05970 [Candidatus Omnitrophica bacterium]|nr:hypothetical protein [Candidatus Omnitrophota bacterium]